MSTTDNTKAVVNPELTLRRFVLRSLLPIVAVVLLAATPLTGPFGFAALVIAWWFLQRKF